MHSAYSISAQPCIDYYQYNNGFYTGLSTTNATSSNSYQLVNEPMSYSTSSCSGAYHYQPQYNDQHHQTPYPMVAMSTGQFSIGSVSSSSSSSSSSSASLLSPQTSLSAISNECEMGMAATEFGLEIKPKLVICDQIKTSTKRTRGSGGCGESKKQDGTGKASSKRIKLEPVEIQTTVSSSNTSTAAGSINTAYSDSDDIYAEHLYRVDFILFFFEIRLKLKSSSF